MRIKHLFIALALLTIAGCGCGDERPPGLNASTPAFDVFMEIPPCEFICDPIPDECLIDVVFAIDDSEIMNRAFRMNAGLPGGTPAGASNDDRSPTAVAQAIFADTETRLLAKINAAKAAGLIPANLEIDLAFAVVRYEDFGGTTVPYQTPNASFTGTIDANARPYILQMPLLRQLHPDFATSFAAALSEQTLGSGDPALVGPNGTPLGSVGDPQSAVEMLWQVATGVGIDGNGANGTVDNGAPCSRTAKGLVPGGAFTDVPAVTYQQNGQDPQDPTRPIYLVLDEAGNAAPPLPPGSPLEAPCVASGNEGGVGFRPNSLRWVIFSSEIATVAPFPGNPNLPPNTTISTPVPASVPSPAFDGVTGRWGVAGGSPIPQQNTEEYAPAYATSVQGAMDALVAGGIEVMALGVGGAVPGQTKPNILPTPPDHEPAIPAPAAADFTPFTMMSAISILTGSQVFDGTATGQDEQPGVGTGPWPAVYNLGTVGELVPGPGGVGGTTNVNDEFIDDLLERIIERVATKDVGGGTVQEEPLPELTAGVLLSLVTSQPDGTANYLRGSPEPVQLSVTIPSYCRDRDTGDLFVIDANGNRVPIAAPPAPVRIELADFVSWLLRDPTLIQGAAPLPIDMLSFTTIGVEQSISNDTVRNTLKVAQLRAKLPQFASLAQVSIQAFRTPVANNQVRNAVLLPGGTAGWCVSFQDVTPGFGPFAEDRFGATCPAAP